MEGLPSAEVMRKVAISKTEDIRGLAKAISDAAATGSFMLEVPILSQETMDKLVAQGFLVAADQVRIRNGVQSYVTVITWVEVELPVPEPQQKRAKKAPAPTALPTDKN